MQPPENNTGSSSVGSGDGPSSDGPNVFIGRDGGHAVFNPWEQGETPGATPPPSDLTPLPQLQTTGIFEELANIYANLPADPFGL